MPDKRYVKPDKSRSGPDDPMVGLLNMWDTEGRRFGNPMGKSEKRRAGVTFSPALRRVSDSLPARPKTTCNASTRSDEKNDMSRGFMTCRARTKHNLMLSSPIRVRPHTTQDRSSGLTPPNKLVESFLGRSCKQQRIYKIQHARGDADGQLSNTSAYNTLKKLAVPDGPPTMDIIG